MEQLCLAVLVCVAVHTCDRLAIKFLMFASVLLAFVVDEASLPSCRFPCGSFVMNNSGSSCCSFRPFVSLAVWFGWIKKIAVRVSHGSLRVDATTLLEIRAIQRSFPPCLQLSSLR
jgi:hypothetical protein